MSVVEVVERCGDHPRGARRCDFPVLLQRCRFGVRIRYGTVAVVGRTCRGRRLPPVRTAPCTVHRETLRLSDPAEVGWAWWLVMALEKGTCRELLKLAVEVDWRGLHELVNPCVASGSRFVCLRLRFVYCSRVVARPEFR